VSVLCKGRGKVCGKGEGAKMRIAFSGFIRGKGGRRENGKRENVKRGKEFHAREGSD